MGPTAKGHRERAGRRPDLAGHAGAGLVAPAVALAALLAMRAAAAPGDVLPPWTDGDVVYVLTSEYDYSAGSDALVHTEAPWPAVLYLDAWVGDTEAVFYQGLVYIVSRWGADHITVLDPRDEYAVVRQFSVGASSNPQHVCFVDNQRAFVTRYETDELWEVNPATGQHTDTIDLGPLADDDGIPEMHKMAIHDGRLYVTIQRIDRTTWEPAGGSCLAVVDLADNTLIDMDPSAAGIQGVPLAAPNPNSGILIDPRTGDFLIGELGFYGTTDGGIERMDPDTHESRGFVLTEDELGGDLHAWTTGNGQDGYAVRLTPGWTTDAVAFDLRSGEVTATIASSAEFAYAHLLVDVVRGELILCDRTYANPGLRIFDTASLQPLTPQPIGVGLYPHWLLAVPGPGSGVVAGPAARAGRIAVWPQPAAGAVTLRVEDAGGEPVTFEVFDAAGRRVAHLAAGPDPAGERIWDARDAAGRPVPPGVYLALSRSGGITRRGTIHLLR